jgi:hypothetical protein
MNSSYISFGKIIKPRSFASFTKQLQREIQTSSVPPALIESVMLGPIKAERETIAAFVIHISQG